MSDFRVPAYSPMPPTSVPDERPGTVDEQSSPPTMDNIRYSNLNHALAFHGIDEAMKHMVPSRTDGMSQEERWKHRANGLQMMRSYLEQPRTTVGWKGLINDRDIDGTFNINRGMDLAHRQAEDIRRDGWPVTSDMLESMTPGDLAYIIKVASVRQKAEEDQLRRELSASPASHSGHDAKLPANVTPQTPDTRDLEAESLGKQTHPKHDGVNLSDVDSYAHGHAAQSQMDQASLTGMAVFPQDLPQGITDKPTRAARRPLCETCGKVFARVADLNRHQDSIHARIHGSDRLHELKDLSIDLRGLSIDVAPSLTRLTKLTTAATVAQEARECLLRRQLRFEHELFAISSEAVAPAGSRYLRWPPKSDHFTDNLIEEHKSSSGLIAAMGVTGAGMSTSVQPMNSWASRQTAIHHLYNWTGISNRTPKVVGQKRYYVEGKLGDLPLEAFPDTGADRCLISPQMALKLGLEVVPGTERPIRLPNKKTVQSPGSVLAPWTFAGESAAHMLDCWVMPGCLHDLVLSNGFLRATKTVTMFMNRIKSRLVSIPRRLRLQLLGQEKQRLWGSLNGHATTALPDTGSDVMLVSGDYARKIGLRVDYRPCNTLEVEFGDGSVAWTSGVAWDVPWTVGGTTVNCDFHVLEELCVDVVLSSDYLFETGVFSHYSDFLFDFESEMDMFDLCNIRLIGRLREDLSGPDDEHLEDLSSPNAFGHDMVQRELYRRDLIRARIAALPEDQRQAALDAEIERQRRWQTAWDGHRLRLAAGISGVSSSHSEGRSLDYGGPCHNSQASNGRLTGRDAEIGQQEGRKPWWRKKVNVSIPLRFLRTGGRGRSIPSV